jgi:hypothetical protein
MNYQIRTVLLAGILATGSVGCKKSFYDNKNPNDITANSITSNLLVPAALHNAGAVDAGGNGIGYNWLNHWMGYWSVSGSFSPNQEQTTYNITGTFMQTRWTLVYNYLNDFHIIAEKAPGEGKDFYAGIAKVMKARYFQDLVDIYGNVPYSQAFQLAKFPTPKYDRGKDIYDNLQVQLDEALQIFKTKAVPAEASSVDIMYQGNKNLWIRFANTIKLRLLIRQSEVAGFDPAAEIAKIVANGGVLQSGESADVNPGYTNATSKQSPFYANFGFTVTGNNANESDRANVYILNVLKANNDQRMQRYFRPASNPSNPGNPYVGTTYGADPDDALNSSRTSGFGPGVAGSASQSQWVLTSIESLFLYAEAVARGWFNGDAKTAYENAVRESFVWLGLSAAQANTYMANNATANWANAGATVTDRVKFIVNQKYLSLVGINPLEAWNDYRRLGVPASLPLSVSPGRIGNGLPVRLLYPTSEFSVNRANVEAQGTINQFTSKVFWDL